MNGENHVEINEGALAAEVASVQLPDEPAGPGQEGEGAALEQAQATLEQVQAHAAHWKGGADFLVNFLCDGIAPNWGVPQEQREKFAQAGSVALAAWFPDDAIPLKWLVLLNVATAGWEIVTATRERHGGRLPPLRLASPKPRQVEQQNGAGGGATTTA